MCIKCMGFGKLWEKRAFFLKFYRIAHYKTKGKVKGLESAYYGCLADDLLFWGLYSASASPLG